MKEGKFKKEKREEKETEENSIIFERFVLEVLA